MDELLVRYEGGTVYLITCNNKSIPKQNKIERHRAPLFHTDHDPIRSIPCRSRRRLPFLCPPPPPPPKAALAKRKYTAGTIGGQTSYMLQADGRLTGGHTSYRRQADILHAKAF